MVFLSHCVLNENVRFPGGATCPGAIPELVAGYVDDGVGISQMPCPEQRAWGGVRKRHLLRLYGCVPLRWHRVRRLALALVTTWTTVRYRRLARIACDIADYTDSGFEVVGVVGVGGSPSCGVATTLDLDGALAALARGHREPDRRSTNRDLVAANAVAGRGLFVACLDRTLQARGVSVSYREHDLIAELRDAGAIAP